MNKSKYLIAAIACLLVSTALWLLIATNHPGSGNPEYEKWKHTEHTIGHVIWWERHLPDSISKWLHLRSREQKYWDEREKLADTLRSTGYLTNVAIAVTHVPTNYLQRAQIAARLRNAFPDPDGWEFFNRSNAIVVTCRPQNETLCRQAITNDK